LKRWISHALDLRDPRFRLHATFVFYVLNMLMRREVSLQACIKVKNGKLDDETDQFVKSLRKVDFENTVKALQSGKPNDNERIKKILENVKSVGSGVPGSPYAKKTQRQEIMSLQMFYGLPSLFVTINPCDLNSRIVCHYAGKITRIDAPDSEVPDFRSRALTSANDPVACAKYFVIFIEAFLETLVGVKKGRAGAVHTTPGVLGHAETYYGTVEMQGRGSLHFHCLIWLKDMPSPDDLQLMLEDSEFRTKFFAYLDDLICNSYPKDPKTVDAQGILTKLPRDPLDAGYEDAFKEEVTGIASKKQVHAHTFTCTKYRNDGKCRFGFGDDGKRLVPETIMDEKGNITVKRGDPFLNSFNESILVAMKPINMDIKVLTTGEAAKCICYYVTKYITKDEMKTHNTVAILAQVQEKCKEAPFALKAMIVKCLNKINVCQELSFVFATLLLLTGFNQELGDHFKADKFCQLYVGPVLKDLRDESAEDEFLILDCQADGSVKTGMQKHDYYYRHESLKDLSLYEFVSKYGTERIPKVRNARLQRHRFLEEHPFYDTKWLVKRSHVIVPKVSFFPPPKENKPEEFYAWVLCVLVPFRHPKDLVDEGESYEDAFTRRGLSEECLRYFKKLEDRMTGQFQADQDRQRHLEEEKEGGPGQALPRAPGRRDVFLEADENVEELLENMNLAVGMGPSCRDKYLSDGIEPFQKAMAAVDDKSGGSREIHGKVRSVGHDEVKNWGKELKNSVAKVKADMENEDNPFGLNQVVNDQLLPDIQLLPERRADDVLVSFSQEVDTCDPNSIASRMTLNKEQRRAFMLVVEHAKSVLLDKKPDVKPLQMTVLGEGGTGKSRVIKAITAYFDVIKKRHALRVCATTGKAACLIGGATAHSTARLPFNCNSSDPTDSVSSTTGLKQEFNGVHYLILDEISLFGTAQLAMLSKNLSIGKCNLEPYGGISVIFFGDFTQFPPVGGTPLYRRLIGPQSNVIKKTEDAVVEKNGKDRPTRKVATKRPPKLGPIAGRVLWTELTHAVILTQQMRAKGDQRFREILGRIRNRSATREDVNLLCTRILGAKGNKSSLDVEPFKSAPVIVARNDLRVEINKKRLNSFVAEQGTIKYVWSSVDAYHEGIIDSISDDTKDKIAQLSYSKTANLEKVIEVAYGCPVTLSYNIGVAMNLSNGSTGKVVGLILDEGDDSSPDESGVQVCRKIPAAVLVKFDNVKCKFSNLDENVVPIVSEEQSFKYKIPQEASRKLSGVEISVRRKQIPIRLSFAITSYAAQGETFPACVVDLRRAETETGGAGVSFAYVPLSRVRSLETLLILRPFDDRVLLSTKAEDDLDVEMKRLTELDKETERKYNSCHTDIFQSPPKVVGTKRKVTHTGDTPVPPGKKLSQPTSEMSTPQDARKREVIHLGDTPDPPTKKLFSKKTNERATNSTVPVRALFPGTEEVLPSHNIKKSSDVPTTTKCGHNLLPNAIRSIFGVCDTEDGRDYERRWWLDDLVMDRVEKLCQAQLNSDCHARRLEGQAVWVATKTYRPCLNFPRKCVHVIGTGSHWVLALSSGDGVVFLDSLDEHIRKPSELIQTNLSQLFPNATDYNVGDSPQQQTMADCGRYALANAVAFVLGEDPRSKKYEEDELRDHLWKIVDNGTITPFPSSRRLFRDYKSFPMKKITPA